MALLPFFIFQLQPWTMLATQKASLHSRVKPGLYLLKILPHKSKLTTLSFKQTDTLHVELESVSSKASCFAV